MFCIVQFVMPLGNEGTKLLFYIISTISMSPSLKQDIIHNQIYFKFRLLVSSLIVFSVLSELKSFSDIWLTC